MLLPWWHRYLGVMHFHRRTNLSTPSHPLAADLDLITSLYSYYPVNSSLLGGRVRVDAVPVSETSALDGECSLQV
jgi:hypothetical protein